MQYFRPGGDFFVGDCMPYFHDGVFHLYYLLDQQHHQSLGGLGGHQWAHAATTNLVDWVHYPMALPITDPDEGSICTGSVYYHAGKHYAFYATRSRDWRQRLSLALSDNAVRFVKTSPRLLIPPHPAYSPFHFRDPFPFFDPATELHHLLVSAQLAKYPLTQRGGCLAHFTSPDLNTWALMEPFLIPGFADVPECSDHFYWNGWYYLIFSNGLTARYRMARGPLGPWLRPQVDTLDGPLARVMRTAAYHGNRRIGVAWIGTREGDKDDGRPQWGGHTLFRELVQYADGTLGIKFPREMASAIGTACQLSPTPVTRPKSVTIAIELNESLRVQLDGAEGLTVASVGRLPRNMRITFRVVPDTLSGAFGLRLRSNGDYEQAYALSFSPAEGIVQLGNTAIYGVSQLDHPLGVEIIVKDDLIDVCIDDRRCLVNRCPELQGDQVFFYAHNAGVAFNNIHIQPLI